MSYPTFRLLAALRGLLLSALLCFKSGDSTYGQFQCSRDGNFRDPFDCSRFYQCKGVKAVHVHCLDGLYFNENTGNCDWPENVVCSSTQLLFQDNSPSCPRKKYFVNPTDCSRYYVCIGRTKISLQCSDGLFFDEQKNVCNRKNLVQCPPLSSSAMTLSTTTSAPNAVQTSLRTSVTTGPFSGCSQGSFKNDPDSCAYYYHCDHGRWHRKHCPFGLHWNNAQLLCDWPQNVQCEVSTSTSRPVRSTRTPLPTSTRKPPSRDNKLKVVCYFTNWAWYRGVGGRFLPEDIDPTFCTHINYAFATLDSSSLTLKPFDSWADIENNFYERVVALKNRNPRLRVLLALGGWTDSAGDKYTRLTASATKRRNFIQHAISFLQQHHFDGLDLDWEFPVCWQSSCGSGPKNDRSNFATFVRELREAFDQVQPTLLLTAAVSASKTIIDNAYDVPTLANNLDFINLMAYDYHGSWEKITGHVAPLYQNPGNPLSANFSLTYWVQKGAPPHKLVLGTPFYGRSFTLASSNVNGIGAPSTGGGKAGPLTKEIGILAYYEICDKMNNQAWRQVKDPSGAIGPYAYREDQWVGFDDPEILSQKAKLVREQGYGGVMMWTVDFDDFSGICCQKPFPLLRALHYGLFGTGDPPETYKCEENLIGRGPPFGIIVPVAHQYPTLLRADQVPL